MTPPRRRATILIAIAATLILLILALGLSLWPPRFLISAVESRHPEVVFRGAPESRRIAITIDDGPHPETTPAILETLARHDVRATFFLLGGRAREHPELVERIRGEGHEIGNHMMVDRPSVLLSREEFARSLEEAETALDLAGSHPIMRPGSGWFRPSMVEECARRGYRIVLGSAYVKDTKLRHAGAITWLLRHRTRAGDIVILHEGSKSRTWTPVVLDDLIPRWKEQGLKVGTVGELLRESEPGALSDR